MDLLTVFGVVALAIMVLSYASERRGARFILVFAAACAAASTYGFLSGAWPFGVVELIWALVALQRWRAARREAARHVD